MADFEIMTLEEVARYLRVSERTVYDWANKGLLPCGKLGTTWRFKRAEVEHWVDERLGSRRILRHEGVAIGDVLAPERVLLLDGTDKRAALGALIEVLSTTPEVHNPEELERELFERERLMSTGIGFGIGVPHVRLGSVSDLVMAVGVTRDALADYESLDGEPVRIVCMIAAHKNQHALYLKILAAVSNILKLDFVRQAILEADHPQTIYELLTHPIADP
ncbi:MAG: PTS sugar transporter subunit IIA [Candidatus Hydrogenedentes bacterium]|nr:PTS sugar transporter subunit IIA [Candidatus Hydrogenedentota bacterium]